MKVGRIIILCALAGAFSSLASATVITTISSALVVGDPTQLGRLSRNGIPQDWSGTEVFPGVINTATTYRYHAYSVNVGLGNFVQIEMDSTSPNTFISAYQTAYLPNSAGAPNFGFNTNWLGDAGFSGNFPSPNSVFFQVIAAPFSNIVVVVSNTGAANLGVGDPFTITVEGFIDSEFTDPPAVPEPTTISMMCLGLGGVLWAARKRGVLEATCR